MSEQRVLTRAVLDIDLAAEAAAIANRLRDLTAHVLRKRGLVVAISGGIDSSVALASAVRAVGADRTLGLILPERESSPGSAIRARQLAEHLGVPVIEESITETLEAIGCYRWRDEAVRHAIPEYGPGWRMKIVIAGGVEGRVNVFHIVAESPEGRRVESRLGLRDYLQIVAATNFKQRVRKTLEYFHADRLNYAVVGTPNRLEYDQGFFVKNGDGAADVKPLAHLYKTQVYALARYLGLPAAVCDAVPTTDTYTLPQGQDEFYFALPYADMDLALWALNHDIPPEVLARSLGIEKKTAEHIYADIRAKRQATRYLQLAPLLVGSVPEIEEGKRQAY